MKKHRTLIVHQNLCKIASPCLWITAFNFFLNCKTDFFRCCSFQADFQTSWTRFFNSPIDVNGSCRPSYTFSFKAFQNQWSSGFKSRDLSGHWSQITSCLLGECRAEKTVFSSPLHTCVMSLFITESNVFMIDLAFLWCCNDHCIVGLSRKSP